MYANTVVIFKKNGNSQRADLVLGAGGKGWVHGANNAQRLHDQSQHL